MPDKRPSAKNEKQYEALKRNGMSQERAARIANSRRLEARGQAVGLRRKPQAGRNHRTEEGCRPQGRQGRGAQALVAFHSDPGRHDPGEPKAARAEARRGRRRGCVR